MTRGAVAIVSPVAEARTTRARRWARPLGGMLILAAILVWLGVDPFLDGLRAVDAPTLLLATVIAVLTTVGAAWRWHLVAGRLHAPLPLSAAVAACYRAQFLNVVLPGGVLGDVDRGVRHGREVEDLARGLRAVAWERIAGQVVLAVLTLGAVLLARPFANSAIAVPSWLAPAVILGALTAAALLARTHLGTRATQVTIADARALARPGLIGKVLLASLVVLAGHVTTFWLATRAVDVALPFSELVPLALLVLFVAALPLNLAGWGPREGAAAWAFAGAGLQASQGLAVAVAYGAMVLVAALPGAVLLVLRSRGRQEEVGNDG